MSTYPAMFTTARVPGAPKAIRDSILRDANGGVTFLFDLAFGYCYPGGDPSARLPPAAPSNGARIADVGDGANGSVSVAAEGAIGYAGGGFTFAAAAARNNCVRAPVGSLAPIQAGLQHFVVVGWFKLPTLADWYAETGVMPIFATNEHAVGYPSAPDLLTIGATSGGGLTARRQTKVGGTVQTASVALPQAFFGKLAQIAVCRDASGMVLRVRTSEGVVTSSLQVGGDENTESLGALQPQWGVTQSLWDFVAKPSLLKFRNMRLYRGWIESLAVSKRDPVEALNLDWTEVTARGAFS